MKAVRGKRRLAVVSAGLDTRPHHRQPAWIHRLMTPPYPDTLIRRGRKVHPGAAELDTDGYIALKTAAGRQRTQPQPDRYRPVVAIRRRQQMQLAIAGVFLAKRPGDSRRG